LKYRLKIAQETVDVDASNPVREQNTEFIIGEETYHVGYQAVSDNCLHLVVDGTAIEAFHIRGGHGKYIFVNGRSFLVEDADQLPSRRGRRTGIDQAPGDVTPPMPSVVVRIMKMETTLKAPYNGRVIKVNTIVDAKVAPGDILVEIEEEEPENE
jgi:acetyl/propionyl-CoA carboxylase alpha subunit